ncbi:MAG: hypothetical protein CMJ85_01020 [Planctomycetes bacterium]|nr:hypothetical protein [Planctomycetota bacterium]
MAQAGTDPNAPIKAIAGQTTTSGTIALAGASVVLPNSCKRRMGNSNNIFGVAWANSRVQQQHSGAQVGNARLFFAHALRFRNNYHIGPTQTLEIKLSNSDTTPATHSATFATNIGTNKQTTVFKGNYKYPNMMPNTDPTKFNIVFPWAAPWLWTNPTGKGLLFETLNTSTVSGNYYVDADSGDATMSRSWARGNPSVGNVDLRYGLVMCLFDRPLSSFDTFGKGCPGTGGKAGVILPAAMRTAMGNSNSSFGVAWANQRYHQLMDGKEAGPGRVFVNHAFRSGTRSDIGPTRTIKILMSKSQVAPLAMSKTFATNIGTNTQTTVFNGTHKYPNMVPSKNPLEFKLVVPWMATWLWWPTPGDNILYEYQCSDPTNAAPYYFPDAIQGNVDVRSLSSPGPAAYWGTVSAAPFGLCICFGYQGKASNIPVLGNTGQPVINTSFDVTLTSAQSTPGVALLIMGFSKTKWGPIPLPLDLTPIGAPGCGLLVSYDAAFGVVVNASHEARFSYFIPNVPALYGFSWHNQYMVFDPTANTLGVVFTNGGTAKIGGV